MRKAPAFWQTGGPLSVLLAPAGWAWSMGAAWRGLGVRPYRAPVPVICVGNVVAGGQGKTPVAISLVEHLHGAHFLSTGYGGRAAGPLRVDVMEHDYRSVGDEPMCLARVAPCWVAKDRAAGAKAAVEAGARCIVMDDGFQDPSLAKDVSFLVVDGETGFGSGRCIPAGPLREPLGRALARADAVVIVGPDRTGVARMVGKVPVLHARFEAEAEASALAGRRVVAFAGIGRPEKFFHTLDGLKARVVAAYAFPDHHPYHPAEITSLVDVANGLGAQLITTAKDMERVPLHLHPHIVVLPGSIVWDDPAAMVRLLSQRLKASR